MDLEIIGKQMLEALAVQGQIAGLETKQEELKREVAEAEISIQKAEGIKASGLVSREEAEGKVNKAMNSVVTAKLQIKQAEANLNLAENLVEKAKEELGKYSDDVLNQFDDVICQRIEAKKAIEVDRDEVVKALEVARENLEARQEELKAQGIELNIGMVRQPRVMVL